MYSLLVFSFLYHQRPGKFLISRRVQGHKPLFCLPSLQVDIPVKYLNFFLEDDDELEHIKKVPFPFLLDFIIFLVRLITLLSEIWASLILNKQQKGSSLILVL